MSRYRWRCHSEENKNNPKAQKRGRIDVDTTTNPSEPLDKKNKENHTNAQEERRTSDVNTTTAVVRDPL